jgi:hypothetical protein
MLVTANNFFFFFTSEWNQKCPKMKIATSVNFPNLKYFISVTTVHGIVIFLILNFIMHLNLKHHCGLSYCYFIVLGLFSWFITTVIRNHGYGGLYTMMVFSPTHSKSQNLLSGNSNDAQLYRWLEKQPQLAHILFTNEVSSHNYGNLHSDHMKIH